MAALQVISQDSFPLLYSVVFGEGVLNDATSIVILGTIQASWVAGCGLLRQVVGWTCHAC